MRQNHKKIKRLLTDHRGESLAETLVALLIAGLSMAMLAGMITTSVRITDESTGSFREYYQMDESVASHSSSDPETETVAIQSGGKNYYIGTDDSTDTGSTGVPSVTVKYYINTEAKGKSVISYERATAD